MRVTPQQRATIVANALALGAAVLSSRGAPRPPAGPRLASGATGDGPRPAAITPAIADRLAAQARDLAAWIGARKAAGATARAATARATVVATAPRTDADKAAAISATWATLNARRAAGSVR